MRMKIMLLLGCLLLATPGFAARKKTKEVEKEREIASSSSSEAPVGGWIASGGIGLTISPTTFLVSPELEYVAKPNLFVGPLVQLGFADAGVLFSTSLAVRTIIGHNPRVKPDVEAGLGIAVASSMFASSVGVNMHFGIGMDYQIEPGIAIGTMIRANFAPPLKTFYMSWPIMMGRFSI